MKALRYHGQRDIRLEEIDDPTPGPGELKVRVSACGICASDVSEYVSGPRVIPKSGHPGRPELMPLPLVLGHEYGGEIVGLGVATDGHRELGQRVAIEPLINCGRCESCRSDESNLCPHQTVMGLSAPSGGFTSYVVVPERLAHPLPAGVDGRTGALVEPIAVGWHGVRQSALGPGGRALIIGAGPVGLGVLMSLRAMAVGLIAVSVRREGARAVCARALGADVVMLPGDGPPGKIARGLTGGLGFDAVFLAAGTPEAVDLALRSVRAGGTVVQLALSDAPTPVDLNRLLAREIRLVGSMGYTAEFPAVIEAIADGRIADPTQMVTADIPIAQAVGDGFERLARHDPDQVKILVVPTA